MTLPPLKQVAKARSGVLFTDDDSDDSDEDYDENAHKLAISPL